MISEDTELSESFKEKARPIFEAAVISRVKAEVTRISESMQQSTERQLKQIQESCEEGINVFAEANAARLDKYMSYLGEQWVKQNKLAIQQGIKSELTEGFMRGLQSLFRQHYINVPEHKMEVVAEQKETISKNKSLVNLENIKNQYIKKYANEILELRKNGNGSQSIEKYLYENHRVKVSRGTIEKFYKQNGL
jgi:intein-encoded DNA endonuclease-like protein